MSKYVLPPIVVTQDDQYQVQYRNEYNYTRLGLLNFSAGLVQWFNEYSDVYHAQLGKQLFQKLFLFENQDFNQKVKLALNNDDSHRARINSICKMSMLALEEHWHSPFFLTKIDEHYYPNTGQQKLYATGLAKSNQEIAVVLFDYDRCLDRNLLDSYTILSTDYDLSQAIGSKDYVLDINITRQGKHIVPGVYHFTKNYPPKYEKDEYYLTDSMINFIKSRLNNSKMHIEILDNFNSKIYDSSGLFSFTTKKIEQRYANSDEVRYGYRKLVAGNWYFHTQKTIDFDLAHLLPYLRESMNMFNAKDKSYFSWIESDDYHEISTAPSR